MSGYFNREASRAGTEPFRAWCEDHLPVPRPTAWEALSADRERARTVLGLAQEDAPHNIAAVLAETFGGRDRLRAYLHNTPEAQRYSLNPRETVRKHAQLMSRPVTPHGFAWTGGIGGNVGAPCEVCGKEC